MALKAGKKFDYVILFPFLILLFGFGLPILASASSDLGKLGEFNDPYYYLKDQLIFGVAIGALVFFFGYLINYRVYNKWSPLILISSVALLLLLFTPFGTAAGGAQRWLTLGSFTIQPSEILKLTMVLYLASWLSSQRTERTRSFSDGLVPFLSIVGLICLMLLFQNSTSAAVIVALTALIMYFAAGARWHYLLLILLAGALVLGLFIFSTGYRMERVQSFLNPSLDVQGTGFQSNQALVVMGSGGLTGVGYGQSNAKKFLPERMGDAIFAILAEELGFIGSFVVILLFATLVVRGFILSRKTRDKFGKLVLVGFSSIIGLQAFIHIASTSGLSPVTGVPLPFISYGQFSLVIFMAMVGIMQNIYRNS